MSVIAPPTTHQQFGELIDFFGSKRAVARYLGRDPALIERWEEQDSFKPKTIVLIDGAWNAAWVLIEAVGRDRLAAVVHQRWPLLGRRTPAELVQTGQAGELLERLEAAASGKVGASGKDEADEALANWFAENLTDGETHAPLEMAMLDDDEEEEEAAPPMLSEAWRGGGTMSSERWFRA
jgi:hypothetical protein